MGSHQRTLTQGQHASPGRAVEGKQKGPIRQERGYRAPGRFPGEGLGLHDLVEASGRPGCAADPEGLTEGSTAARVTAPGPSAPSPSRAESACSKALREAQLHPETPREDCQA